MGANIAMAGRRDRRPKWPLLRYRPPSIFRCAGRTPPPSYPPHPPPKKKQLGLIHSFIIHSIIHSFIRKTKVQRPEPNEKMKQTAYGKQERCYKISPYCIHIFIVRYGGEVNVDGGGGVISETIFETVLM